MPTFEELQTHLAKHSYLTAEHTNKQRTLVYIAGMSLDQEELAKVVGIEWYEERLLYVIGLLRNPRTTVLFITSKQVNPDIVEYYFDLFSRNDKEKAAMRKRWHNLYIGNSRTHKTLTQKVLSSKRVQKAIRANMSNPETTVLRCFNVSEDERALALELGVPLFAPNPDALHWGSKSGARKAFKKAGHKPAFGFEDIKTLDDLVKKIQLIKQKRKSANQVVVKFDNSFSGVGNAIVPLKGFPRTVAAGKKFLRKNVKPCESGMTPSQYLSKFVELGGVVEEWVEGGKVHSPSVQVLITPDGKTEILSSHEQLLDEETKQVYLGARFPARKSLRPYIIKQAKAIGKVLADNGIIGPFGVDFLVVKRGERVTTYPVEINLRKGGTTHPFQIARMLTEGVKRPEGYMRGNNKKKVYYHSFDNIKSEAYKGLKPQELIDVVRAAGLEFDSENNLGVALHLMGAVTKYGKFGAVCIARSPKAAEQLFVLLTKVLDAHVATQEVAPAQQDPVIDRDRMVKTFVELAKISSPSGEEDDIRMVLREKLVALGCKVRSDKAGNIIAKRPASGGSKQKVPYLLSAHMDTVGPCDNVRPVVRGDMIMTDGNTILGADDKAGITYILEALEVASSFQLPVRPLEIVFTAREEQFSQGASELNFAALKSPCGLVVDGADVGEVDYTAPYIAVLNITITGKTSHSGVAPEKGVSAVQIMAGAIAKMKLGRVDAQTTANIGVVQGGTNRNIIPGEVTMVGEVRSLSKRKLEDQLERMHKALEDAAEQFGGLLNIDSRVAVEGYTIDKKHPHIKKIMEHMKGVGIEPELRKAGGGSDANVFINTGIMAIDVGTGVQNLHTIQEQININDMEHMSEFILNSITT